MNTFDESDVSDENINNQYYHESSSNKNNNANIQANKQNISPLIKKVKSNKSFTNVYEDENENDNL